MEKQYLLASEEQGDSEGYTEVEREEIEEEGPENSGFHLEITGFLVCVFGCVFVATSAVCVKKLDGTIPDIQLNCFRFCAILVMTLPYFFKKRTLPLVTESELPGWRLGIHVLLWALAGIHGNLFHYTSVMYVNIGKSISVSRIVTTTAAAFTTKLVMKDKVNLVQLVSILVGCFAVVLAYQRDIFKGQLDNLFTNNNKLLENENSTFETNNQRNATTINIINVTVSKTSTFDARITAVGKKAKSSGCSTNVIIGIFLSVLCGLCNNTHYTLQKINLKGINVWVASFWYSVLGVTISLASSAILEQMNLPSSGREWAFLIGHSFGGGLFGMTTLVAQQMASLLTISLALGFQLVCYFVAQYIFFFECSTNLGLAAEVTGAVLVIISACMDPLHKVIVHYKNKVSDGNGSYPDGKKNAGYTKLQDSQ